MIPCSQVPQDSFVYHRIQLNIQRKSTAIIRFRQTMRAHSLSVSYPYGCRICWFRWQTATEITSWYACSTAFGKFILMSTLLSSWDIWFRISRSNICIQWFTPQTLPYFLTTCIHCSWLDWKIQKLEMWFLIATKTCPMVGTQKNKENFSKILLSGCPRGRKFQKIWF